MQLKKREIKEFPKSKGKISLWFKIITEDSSCFLMKTPELMFSRSARILNLGKLHFILVRDI